MNSIPQLIEAGVTLFTSLIANLPTIIVELVKAVPQIITGLVEAFGKGIGSFVEIGANMVKGLWEGIKSLASWLWDKVSNWASNLWNGILDFFGIHSPSTMFRDMIGKNLVRGIAVGVDVETPNLQDDLQENLGSVTAGLEGTLGAENAKLKVSGGGFGSINLGGITFHIDNFYNSTDKDMEKLTEEAMECAEEYIRRRGGVFA